MNIYLVGGAVRDELLGLEGSDRDWVVVGSTPEEMLGLGYQNVGKDFPVFLHPETHEEYALARLERKVAPGYHGFVLEHSPQVTLEEDLSRRDLTINAMAKDASGRLIDPHHGAKDLENKVLRHVGPAFVEDPVRVLRLARFAARFFDFTLAPETRQLCQNMAQGSELQSLVPERVWTETSKALMSEHPSRFFSVLKRVNALSILMPHWPPSHWLEDSAPWQQMLLNIDACAKSKLGLDERYGALFFPIASAKDCDPQTTQALWSQSASLTAQALRVNTGAKELSLLMQSVSGSTLFENPHTLAQHAYEIIKEADGFRRPERFGSWLKVLTLMVQNQLPNQNPSNTLSRSEALGQLQAAWQRACALDLKALTQAAQQMGLEGPQIGQWIETQRQHAIQS